MVHRYHDATKHDFDRFSRSIGYLDWASQPQPFRSFAGTGLYQLPQHSLLHRGPTPGADAPGPSSSRVSRTERHSTPIAYDQLFDGPPVAPAPVSAEAIGELLRHSLGLSAWKQFRESRWALRVNPSSGNLHPTEAYLVAGPVAGLAETAAVYHYAPDRHALEERCAFDAAAWAGAVGDGSCVALVALTSIHWREAWKYGERAFRYCQHDLGHAIAAIRFAAALVGWKAAMVPAWPQSEIAALVGVNRDADFANAEREEPACVLALTADRELPTADCRLLTESRLLVNAAREGRWSGRANQLSEVHVEWPIIDEVARATADAGHLVVGRPHPSHLSHPSHTPHPSHRSLDARTIVLQRRSALAFDARSSIDRQAFLSMLDRTLPGPRAPWDALWWTPRIHLALFVHRVDGVAPGLYALVRSAAAVDRLKA
ncbi:MAG: SagB/ThcOx family dehydrogenase, partial [Vicinamibacterales bacterium]